MGHDVSYEKIDEGFRWNWVSGRSTEEELTLRVPEQYMLNQEFYQNKIILDAGCGAGDQTKWMHKCHAKAIVSIDLSDAIYVTEKKCVKTPTLLPYGVILLIFQLQMIFLILYIAKV